MRPSRRTTSKARAALLWAVLLFAVGQLALGIFIYRRHPELSDSAYSARLHRLRERLEEGSDRPLFLVLGSSRPVFGFRPSLVRAASRTNYDEPILFNFAFVGAGPVRQWMMLRRLLADGVRPDCVMLEVWTPFLAQAGMCDEEKGLLGIERQWTDIALLARFYHRRWEATDSVIEKHLTPAIHYRLGLLNHYAPSFQPTELARRLQSKESEGRYLDESGALLASDDVIPPQARPRASKVWLSHVRSILDDFRISERADGALHGLLDECRNRGIKVMLFLMPEHSALRAVYPPRVNALVHHYLAQLRDEYRVPVIDGRTWCPDEEFGDICHLLSSGGATFSRRFGRDVYRPLLQGRLLPRDVLFDDPHGEE